MADHERRVMVTGVGVVSPLGNDVETLWTNLVAGVSGAGPITRFDASNLDSRFACEVKDFSTEGVLDRKDSKRMDRFVQYAAVAAHGAMQWARLDLDAVDRDRVGVVIGSGIGGMETFETQHRILLEKGPGRVSPYFIPMMISDMARSDSACEVRISARSRRALQGHTRSANPSGSCGPVTRT
jgi:3-oxoacyl-[acyl-carrier-protein] synthase II